MIEILTLFLGLYHGPQTVEVRVGESVAVVEFWLDGEAIGRVSQPPWAVRVDLGPDLEPHELIAIARDAEGGDVGRARRWVNREIERSTESDPRRDLMTAVILSSEPGIRLPSAEDMQQWFSASGQPIEVIRVESGTAEVVIVRDLAVQPYLERTASFFFPPRLECHHAWDTVTLMDRQAFIEACRRALITSEDKGDALRAGVVWEQWRNAFGFGADVGVRFLSPRAAPVSRVAHRNRIFNLTTETPSAKKGLLWHSVAARSLDFGARISDAVAMAGLEAHASGQRRAVVLMVAGEATGSNRYPPAAVRDYLEDLGVPLFIWNFGLVEPAGPAASGPAASGPAASGPAASGALDVWGEVRDLTHSATLDATAISYWLYQVAAATEEVREELRRQHVVWLRGAHPPWRVELSEQAVGVRLAGSPVAISEEGVD